MAVFALVDWFGTPSQPIKLTYQSRRLSKLHLHREHFPHRRTCRKTCTISSLALRVRNERKSYSQFRVHSIPHIELHWGHLGHLGTVHSRCIAAIFRESFCSCICRQHPSLKKGGTDQGSERKIILSIIYRSQRARRH